MTKLPYNLDDHIDEIYAAIFTGDAFHDSDASHKLCGIIKRWKRELDRITNSKDAPTEQPIVSNDFRNPLFEELEWIRPPITSDQDSLEDRLEDEEDTITSKKE